jgi:hypothetical protein
MTPESAQYTDPTPAEMGTFSRIIGVFFEPAKTFEDIGRRPTWFVPLLLTILAGLAFYMAYGQHVGWARFINQQMTTNPRVQQAMAQIPPDQLESRIAMQAKITGIGYYVSMFIVLPIVMLISSAVLLGMTAMMSAGLRYKQIFAIVCFAGLPMVIKNLLSLVVVFLKNPDDFNLTNPLAFNIAAFMDPLTSSKFLYTLGAMFDLFAIWTIVLTAVGLSAAAGKKRLSFGGGLFAAATPWVVFGLLVGGMAAAFS